MNPFYRLRQWLPLFPLLALLGVAYWLNQQARPDTSPPVENQRHDPDAIVENFSAITLNQNGMPHFVIAAAQMLHYPDDDSTILKAPHVTWHSEGLPAVSADADQGNVSGTGDEITLQGNVKVLRAASKQRNELRVETELLHIIPDHELAQTDHAVTVTEDHGTLHAVGMKMDSRGRTLQLLSQVRSEYVPAEN